MRRSIAILVLLSICGSAVAEEPRHIQSETWQNFARAARSERVGEHIHHTWVVADAARPLIPDRAPDPDPNESLKISVGDDRSFKIESTGPLLVDTPGRYLLARWWVNGESVAARPDASPSAAAYSGPPPDRMREFSVQFGLPDFLGDVKVGDEIDLEVLYVPFALISPIYPRNRPALAPTTDRAKAQTQPERLPLLSNRLKFVIDEAMLKEKDHPIPTPTTRAGVPFQEWIEGLGRRGTTQPASRYAQ